MEAYQKMHHLFHNLLRRLFIFIGHDIFRDGEFKPYTLTFIIYGIFCTFLVGIYKTFAYYDIEVKLNMAAFIGLTLEVNDKFVEN